MYMATSTSTSICQPLTELQNKAATSDESCRLRYGLNENCLLHVFEYLSVRDLIQVCKLDIYFKQLITKWTVRKRIFEVEGLLETKEPKSYDCEVFQTFGKTMRRFKLYTNYLMTFIEIIIKYCEPATLTEIDLEHCVTQEVDLDVLRLSMPYFSNLRKLKFRADDNDYSWHTEFLTQISLTASNLQILILIDIVVEGGWLNNIRNLRELHVEGIFSLFKIEDLTSGLRMLKVFKFESYQDITITISDALSKYCPNLETLIDEHIIYSNPYIRVGVDLIHRYDFLSSFPYLNSVTLTSYTFCGSDLYYPLITLATKNIVKLGVFMNGSKPIFLNAEEKAQILRHSLPHHFTGLQTVEIEISLNVGDEVSPISFDLDPKWRQFDLRCQFIFKFLSKLKNLKRVNFLGYSGYMSNMHKILEYTPNIPTLDMSELERVQPKEIQNMVKILRRVKQLNGGNKRNLLHLLMNSSCSVYGYTDFEDVIKISFHKTDGN